VVGGHSGNNGSIGNGSGNNVDVDDGARSEQL